MICSDYVKITIHERVDGSCDVLVECCRWRGAKFKQMFIAELLDQVKEGNRKAREIDAYIMNGTVPPMLILATGSFLGERLESQYGDEFLLARNN